MEFEELVKSFADKYGIADFAAVDGIAALSIDGMSIALMYDGTSDFMTIYGEIGMPPPDPNGPFGQVMLQANHLFGGTDGAVLCQNPETKSYAIFRRLDLARTDVESLSASIERTVTQVSDWKQILGGFLKVEDESKKAAEESMEISPLSSGPFIQV